MANPQLENGFVRLANDIQEQVMVSDFTEQQRRILDLILRLSYGCGKKSAIIPHQRTFEVVGIGENKIKYHLDWFVRSKVLSRDGAVYTINKNYDDWRVTRALMYSPEKLAELVSLNLAEKGSISPELAEKGSLPLNINNENLPNRETNTCRIGKLPTIDANAPKDSIKTIVPTTTDDISEKDQELAAVFKTFEAEINALTPSVAEGIKTWLDEHPAEHVIEAIKEAAKAGVRKVNYINAILENWKTNGYKSKKVDPKNDPDKYTRGKYQALVKK